MTVKASAIWVELLWKVALLLLRLLSYCWCSFLQVVLNDTSGLGRCQKLCWSSAVVVHVIAHHWLWLMRPVMSLKPWQLPYLRTVALAQNRYVTSVAVNIDKLQSWIKCACSLSYVLLLQDVVYFWKNYYITSILQRCWEETCMVCKLVACWHRQWSPIVWMYSVRWVWWLLNLSYMVK